MKTKNSTKKMHSSDGTHVKLQISNVLHRFTRVVLSTSTSDWINFHQGVPQGTVLGPLLSIDMLTT